MAQPGSLSALALDTLGKYTYGLCCTLTCTDTEKMATAFRIKERSCRNLQKYLTNHPLLDFDISESFMVMGPLGRRRTLPDIVLKRKKLGLQKDDLIFALTHLQDLVAQTPPTLANDVTNKLMDIIDNWDFEWGDHKELMQGKILDELVKSIIHPAVTRIEPPQDHLDCSYVFPETVFCSDLVVMLILKNVHLLKNLTALHLNTSRVKFDLKEVNFPEKLVEFSGRCDNEGLARIAESCKFLKFLNVFGSKGITNSSADTILKMTHLVKLNIAETKIKRMGIKRLVEGLYALSENSPKLKYLALSTDRVTLLDNLKHVPNLMLGLQLTALHFPAAQTFQLLSFQNISGLQLSTTITSMNALLREIGSQLVYLDVEFQYFSIPVPDNNLKVEKLLEIGQNCSSLKCLHLEINHYHICSPKNYVGESLPGFQTVCCLTLDIKCKLNDNKFLNFLFSQCVNVKKVMLTFDKRALDMYGLIGNILTTGCLRKLEVIYFQPLCERCEDRLNIISCNVFQLETVSRTVKMLITHCPYLRVIGGVPELYKIHSHNTQKLKFVPSWCQCRW